MLRSRLVREGSLGLFFLLGVILFGSAVFFLKGRSPQGSLYQIKLLFENAGGLKEGARVYYRGVEVGKVTDIQPRSNGVVILTEIDSSLRIPKDVNVSTLRTGLLGEVSISMVPKKDIQDLALQINPLDENCPQQDLIVCDGQQIDGKSYPDVVESLSLLADRVNNEQFFEIINETLVNVNEISAKVTTLTDDVATVTNQLNSSLKTFSTTGQKLGKTADSLTTTANVAREQIEDLGNSYANTGVEVNMLVSNLNQLVDENKVSFSDGLANLSDMTAEISRLVDNTDQLLSNINPDDVVKISNNLGNTSENLAKISQDLQGVSAELNDPTNLVSLQEALDSARVTFANTAKITSDIDEFTGDPEFRNNLRKLVDGLGNLVSYTEILEQQVELAKILQEVEQIKIKENSSISINKNQKLEQNSQLFPKAFSSSHQINLPNNK